MQYNNYRTTIMCHVSTSRNIIRKWEGEMHWLHSAQRTATTADFQIDVLWSWIHHQIGWKCIKLKVGEILNVDVYQITLLATRPLPREWISINHLLASVWWRGPALICTSWRGAGGKEEFVLMLSHQAQISNLLTSGVPSVDSFSEASS